MVVDFSKHKHLVFKLRFWKIMGNEIRITPLESNDLVGFISQKAWKLREDIRVYQDDSKQEELFIIRARNIVDIAATYDVFESGSSLVRLSLKRRGLRSTFVRDHWDIMDKSGAAIAEIEETSGGLALVRRWIGLIPFVGPIAEIILNFVKQTYTVQRPDKTALATITLRKNPLLVRYELDTSALPDDVDALIPFAATTLLTIIDSEKN